LEPDGAPGSVAWLQGRDRRLVRPLQPDALSGLANRRSFEMALAARDRPGGALRASRPCCSSWTSTISSGQRQLRSPAWRDLVITAVAETIEQTCARWTAARIGGEEFAIILPNCAPPFGLAVAERVRSACPNRTSKSPGQMLGVTVSIGGAFAPQWVRSSPLLWMERADRQLYRAKAEGATAPAWNPRSTPGQRRGKGHAVRL
jgi:GGDEF domain-containing protein